MKKLIIGLLFTVGVIAFTQSCQREDLQVVSQEVSQINEQKSTSEISFARWFELNSHRLNEVTRAEIIKFENPDTRRSIFRSLPAQTKVLMWKEKFNSLLQEPLSVNQAKFIMKADSCVELSLYTTAMNSATHQKLVALRTEGAQLFDDDAIYLILSDFENPSELIGRRRDRGAGLQCTCSQVSDWCSGGAIQIEATCSAPCQDLDSGCGTLFGYTCNGRCRLGSE